MKRLLCTILIIIQIACLAACGKPKKINIESKYNISLNNVNDTTLPIIEDYFKKMPEGFIDELLVREQNANRKIDIEIKETDGSVYCEWSDENGFKWTLDMDGDIEWQLGNCTMSAIVINLRNRDDDIVYFSKWQELCPEGFSYSDTEMFEKYKFNPENLEESYFAEETAPKNIVEEITDLFGYLTSSDVNFSKYLSSMPHIRDKFKYLCEEIDRAFETVNGKTYWSRYFY